MEHYNSVQVMVHPKGYEALLIINDRVVVIDKDFLNTLGGIKIFSMASFLLSRTLQKIDIILGAVQESLEKYTVNELLDIQEELQHYNLDNYNIASPDRDIESDVLCNIAYHHAPRNMTLGGIL